MTGILDLAIKARDMRVLGMERDQGSLTRNDIMSKHIGISTDRLQGGMRAGSALSYKRKGRGGGQEVAAGRYTPGHLPRGALAGRSVHHIRIIAQLHRDAKGHPQRMVGINMYTLGLNGSNTSG
jgi:hypothetical protein